MITVTDVMPRSFLSQSRNSQDNMKNILVLLIRLNGCIKNLVRELGHCVVCFFRHCTAHSTL